MVTEDILFLETSEPGCIHLVRDRLFWQAWERSAFFFVRLLRPYRVHHKFVQKVGMDLTWLGFPESVLPALQNVATANGWGWEPVSKDHVKITEIPGLEGFEAWKEKILADTSVPGSAKKEKESVCAYSNPDMLRAYRLIYDFDLYMFRLSARFNRDFRFGMGERLRGSLTDLLESLHLSLNHLEFFDTASALRLLQRVRVELRLLCDLKQLSEKQWFFANKSMEDIFKLLQPESARPRTGGECNEKSSGPLSSFGFPGRNSGSGAEKTSTGSALL